MLKGNYKAWIISITLHAMLLLLFVRYGKSVKLPAVAEPPKVINAYVSVDLTSLPSLQKTQDKPLLEQPQGRYNCQPTPSRESTTGLIRSNLKQFRPRSSQGVLLKDVSLREG